MVPVEKIADQLGDFLDRMVLSCQAFPPHYFPNGLFRSQPFPARP
jgi:hypothetical protein